MKANDRELRTKTVTFRMSKSEYAALKRQAEDSKMSVSDWLRHGIRFTLIPMSLADQAMKSIKKA